MSEQDPTVTVIIPVYNSADTLERAVRSVQRQSLDDWDLIIVDDGSRDRTLTLANEFARGDGRLGVITLPQNGGKSHAMNVATATAKGRWVAVLDADDWYEPERLETLVAAGERANVDLVADNQFFHDAGADTIVRTAFPETRGDTPLNRATFIAASDPYADFNYGMLKPIVRTDFIRRSGLAYRENTRLSEDFLYLVEFLAANGVGALLSRPLYNWTQAFGSISREWTTTGLGSWRYDFHAALGANADTIIILRSQDEHALADLLLARDKAFSRLHRLSELRRSRQAGAKLPEILGMVIQHPSVWPLLTRRALRAARIIKEP